ncbi:MAG: undecaprenyl/decaprenyl-phosphate alpha-N-acetylglucosaminyl 1-phosphate transferase [Planctomycetales bacterium]|nr:undecaprenyl/decaprenyl-phosphate alpha-N-acetylglucosaminyl 1-phosphate transferase [Planctomycetales bacterium]
MHEITEWQLVGWTFVAAGLAYVLTWAARRWAPVIGFVDRPDATRKLHGREVPLLGGAAVLGGILLTILAAYLFNRPQLGEPRQAISELVPILISAVAFCVLGLFDDRVGMRARTKFLGQILCSLPFALLGAQVESIELLGNHLSFEGWGWVFTLFWLVACSNVVNLIDGMDGLASSIGMIAALSLSAATFLTGRLEVALLGLVLAGSLAGFLAHNWPPAKIFLGDAGSLTIGFLLGAIAIQGAMKQTTGFTLAVPLVIISVPVFDTLMAILRRKLSGRGIGEADRCHIHHRLQDRGLNRRQALIVIVSLSSAMAASAVAAVYFDHDWIAICSCVAICCGLIAGRVFGHYETRLFFGHLHEMTGLVLDTSRQLPTRLLAARVKYVDRQEHGNLWDDACERVAKMGATQLRFVCRDAATDQVMTRKTWNAGREESSSDVVWHFRLCSLRDDQSQVSMEVDGAGSQMSNQRLDGLYRLLLYFCHHWHFDRSATAESAPPVTTRAELPRLWTDEEATSASAELAERRRQAA